MDSVRYYLALCLVMVSPAAYLFWFSVHPFVRFWRGLGTRKTFAIQYTLMALSAALIFVFREPILSVEFGTNPVLLVLAAPVYALGAAIALRRRKQLGRKVLIGLPELDPQEYESRLVTAGIYSRMRHPRYVELLLFLLGHSLVTNYLAVYVVFLLSVAGIQVVIWLEEKELRERFGADHERYCERVPRFLPRL